MLLICCSSSFVSCAEKSDIKIIEAPVTVKGATRSFKEEHVALMLENIRLAAELEECRKK